MTVNTTKITSGPYAGNDIADTFSYTFRIADKNQLDVYETNAMGTETLLTVDTDYTVAGVGVDQGGTITRVAGALPTNSTLYIRASYQKTQLTAFQSQGAFFPDLHEDAMDKMTFLIQQVCDGLDRTPRLSDSYSGELPLSMDDPIPGHAVRWNGGGTGFENYDPSTVSNGDVLPDKHVINYPTLSAALADESMVLNQACNLKEHSFGGGGGGIWDVVTGQPVDGVSVVNHTTLPLQLQFRVDGNINLRQLGAVTGVDISPILAVAESLLPNGGAIEVDRINGGYYLADSYNFTTNGLVIYSRNRGLIYHDAASTFNGLLTLSGDDMEATGLIIQNTEAVSSVIQIGIEVIGSGCIVENNRFLNFRYCVLGRAAAEFTMVSRNFFDTGDKGLTACVLNGNNSIQALNVVKKFGDTAFGVTATAKNNIVALNVAKARDTGASLGVIVEEDAENTLVALNVLDGNYNGVPATGAQYGIRAADNATGECPRNTLLSTNITTNFRTYGIFSLNSGVTRDHENLLVTSNISTDNGSNNFRIEDVSYGVVGLNVSSNSEGDGLNQINTSYVPVGMNVSHDNVGIGMFPDKSLIAPFFANVSVSNGTNYDFTRPTSTASYMLNYGHENNQRLGDMKEIIREVIVPAGNNVTIAVDVIPDQGQYTLYEVVAFTDISGTTDETLKIQTDSNLGGGMSGVVTHGNLIYADRSNPIISQGNNFGVNKYVRTRVNNTSGGSITAYVSIKYRVAGGI